MSREIGLAKRFLQEFPSGVPGLIVDLVEYEGEGYIGLRIYREQFDAFSESNRQKIAEWLRVVIPTLNANKIKCIIDVEAYVPNERSEWK